MARKWRIFIENMDSKGQSPTSEQLGARRAMNKKYWGFLPLPLFIGLIAALNFTIDPAVYYDPGWLIPVTNTLFVTLIYLTVAYVAMRSFTATGQIQILLLGCGTLIFGLEAVCAGFARGLPAGANLNVTIYNAGALITTFFFSVATMMVLAGLSPAVRPAQRNAVATFGYLATMIIAALLALAALRGAIPPFFVQGAGPTPLRQAVLGTADVLFVLSFLICIGTYFRTKEVFLYWYAISMALTSVSLTAFFIQSSVGSPVGWVGRLSQYVGGAYLLVALVAVRSSAHERKMSFNNVLTFSLSSGEGAFASTTAESPNVVNRLDADLKHIYLEESVDAFYVKDAQGRYLMFNREAGRVTGRSPEEVIGKDDYFLFPAAEAKKVMSGDKKVMQGGQVTTFEEIVQTVDGTKTYSTTKGPLFDDHGKVVGLFGIARDITERKRAEEALRKSEQEFRTLAEAMPQIVWTARPDGWNTYFNQQWVDYTGMTLEESYGEGWSIPFHPDDRQRSQEAWSHATTTGEAYEVEVRLRRADGAYRWWLIRGVPLRCAEGTILTWFGTCTDIENLKQAEAQAEQMRRLYATLSQVNHTIVRVKDTSELYRSMCDVAVEFGEFALAWVGLHDRDSGDIKPVAANGIDVAQWPFAIVNTARGDSKDGLVSKAIRLGKVVITEDIQTDRKMRNVLRQIQGRDYYSIAAIPFRLRGVTFGVLVLVSSVPGFFKAANEVKLLEEMGFDISFALDSMATEAEREHAEESLKESERQFKGLFESSPIPVSLNEVICDAVGRPRDYRCLFVNSAYERFAHAKAADLVGRTAFEFNPRSDPAIVERLGQVALTGVPDHWEAFSITLDIYFEITAYSPRRGQFVSHFVDITVRRHAEKTLAASAARLARITDLLEHTGKMAKVGGWELDLRNSVLFWSLETYRIHEVDPDVEPSVAQAQDYYSPEAKATLEAMIKAAIDYGTPWDYQLPMTTAKGRHIWVRGQGFAVMEQGQTVMLRGSFQDITAEKQAEYELGEGRVRLEALLTERERNLEKIAGSLYSVIAVVSKVVEARDPYTAGHERRVAELAVRIAAEVGMSAEQVEDIRTAAMLHDVGKISVPVEILSKPGRLSDIEFRLIKGHSESGFEILSAANMEHGIAEMVYQHHERCDGSGYPRGLKSNEILEGAKVLAVADVVEAMVSHRPYRPGLGVDAALAEIERGLGKQYDARVSKACLKCFREHGFAFTDS